MSRARALRAASESLKIRKLAVQSQPLTILAVFLLVNVDSWGREKTEQEENINLLHRKLMGFCLSLHCALKVTQSSSHRRMAGTGPKIGTHCNVWKD